MELFSLTHSGWYFFFFFFWMVLSVAFTKYVDSLSVCFFADTVQWNIHYFLYFYLSSFGLIAFVVCEKQGNMHIFYN